MPNWKRYGGSEHRNSEDMVALDAEIEKMVALKVETKNMVALNAKTKNARR